MKQNRLIVLDTETTGLDCKVDKVIEIGCIEIQNQRICDRSKRWCINPQQMVSKESFAIHQLSNEFLKTQPVFSEIVDDFLDFIGEEATLLAHNASFDINFLNEELQRLKRPKLPNPVIDTLKIARKKHFGQPNSLDALCKRYHIDNTHRKHHSALVDSHLLAQIYLKMCMQQDQLFQKKSSENHAHASDETHSHTMDWSALNQLILVPSHNKPS